MVFFRPQGPNGQFLYFWLRVISTTMVVIEQILVVTGFFFVRVVYVFGRSCSYWTLDYHYNQVSRINDVTYHGGNSFSTCTSWFFLGLVIALTSCHGFEFTLLFLDDAFPIVQQVKRFLNAELEFGDDTLNSVSCC